MTGFFVSIYFVFLQNQLVAFAAPTPSLINNSKEGLLVLRQRSSFSFVTHR